MGHGRHTLRSISDPVYPAQPRKVRGKKMESDGMACDTTFKLRLYIENTSSSTSSKLA